MMKTKELQEMIDACPKGGKVTLPKGDHLTGALFLKSDMTLEIPADCQLLGSEELADYPLIDTRVAGIEMRWPAALLNGIDCQGLIITGAGKINGQGRVWWEQYWGTDRNSGMMAEYASKGLRWVVDYECPRPQNILLQNCEDVLIQDIHSLDSGFWNIHLLLSKNVTVTNVQVLNGKGPSTDGIDIDACQQVLIEDCSITCNDDNICVKAGRGLTAHEKKQTCQDIIVRNCTMGDGEGLTLGSEVSGGIRNVRFENIKMEETRVGFRIKSSTNRGGFVQDIVVKDIEMIDVETPIQFDLDWFSDYSKGVAVDSDLDALPHHWQELLRDVKGEEGKTPVSRLQIENITVKNPKKMVEKAFYINGYESKPIREVTFKNLSIEAPEFGQITGLTEAVFEGMDIRLAN